MSRPESQPLHGSHLRWAVLGTGGITKTFVPDLLTAGAPVTAIWGRREEVLQECATTHGIPFHSTDLDAILARDDVDAVYIATPPAIHLEQALRALDAGKHVLVEKPMTTSAEDSAKIFARARERGLFAMEAMWMKFNPLHRELFQRIEDGLIGTPGYVRGGFGMPFPQGGSRWIAEVGGSTVLDQGIYPVTLAVWALGPVKSVSARGVVREGVDVSAHITLEHESGAFSQVACSMLEFIDPSASVSGPLGWVEIPAMFWAGSRAELHAGTAEAVFHEPDQLTFERHGNGYVPMIESVEQAVASGLLQHPLHDEQATLGVAQILDEIRRQVHTVTH